MILSDQAVCSWKQSASSWGWPWATRCAKQAAIYISFLMWPWPYQAAPLFLSYGWRNRGQDVIPVALSLELISSGAVIHTWAGLTSKSCLFPAPFLNQLDVSFLKKGASSWGLRQSREVTLWVWLRLSFRHLAKVKVKPWQRRWSIINQSDVQNIRDPRKNLQAACLHMLFKCVPTDSRVGPAPGRHREVWKDLDKGSWEMH